MLIKGVHHQIIEIRQTDDTYFDRALLFVRPEYAARPSEQLQEEGRRFLTQTDSFTQLRHNRAMCWFKRCALMLASAIGGILLGVLLANGV